MFSKFTTKIWKAPDVSQEMQPINNTASITCQPCPSPYPTCLVPTDNDDELSIFPFLDFAFSWSKWQTWQPPKHFLNFQKITTDSTYIPISLVHLSCFIIPFCILSFCHLRMTKIPSRAPLQILETLEMPNTETNTSLVNGIGVQEYSRCFKEICLISVIWKVTSHKVYIFTYL